MVTCDVIFYLRMLLHNMTSIYLFEPYIPKKIDHKMWYNMVPGEGLL